MISKEALTLVFEQLEQEYPLHGAMLVAQDEEVIFEKAYGLASQQLNVPNLLTTKFHIASNTKMFIATAALILYERGLLDLHARPATYIPEMGVLHPGITLHHLLSHTSGIKEVYDVEHLRFEMKKLKVEKGNLLTYLLQLPQLLLPGERWSYSTTGFILLGYIMEQVTGLSFTALMERYILSPLGMVDTGLDIPRRINPGRAYGHTLENGQRINAPNDRLSEFDAPGEFYSTVGDLKKWCDAVFASKLLSPQTQELMFTPHAQVESVLNYGYGWFLGSRSRMHGGGTPGFVSRIKQYPDQKISIILLLNSDEVDPEVILRKIDPLISA